MKSFLHIDARTTRAASGLMKKYAGRAKLIAGGTDLLGSLKDRILPVYPEALINLKTIKGLDYIREDPRGLKIGALTHLDDLANSAIIKKEYKILAAAAESVATPQICRMATLGGNLCQDVRCWYYRFPHQIGGRLNCLLKGGRTCYAVSGENRYHSIFGSWRGCFAVNPSDLAVVLLALNARVRIVTAEGLRTIPLVDYYQSREVIGEGGIVREILVPRIPVNSRQSFIKFRLRNSLDFAIVSVAVLVILDDRRCREVHLALGSVAPVPLRATAAEQSIKEKVFNRANVAQLAEMAVSGCKPLSHNSYKVEILKTLIERAVLSST
jgi:xanthine dehydrogenase YagS FAD-binding subunit